MHKNSYYLFSILVLLLLSSDYSWSQSDQNIEGTEMYQDKAAYFQVRVGIEVPGTSFEALGINEDEMTSMAEMTARGSGFNVSLSTENLLIITFVDSTIHQGKVCVDVKAEYNNNVNGNSMELGSVTISSQDFTREKYIEKKNATPLKLLTTCQELITPIMRKAYSAALQKTSKTYHYINNAQ